MAIPAPAPGTDAVAVYEHVGSASSNSRCSPRTLRTQTVYRAWRHLALRNGITYVSVQRRATKCASATTSIACAVQESAHQVL